MWNKFNIKTQFIILFSLVVILIESLTLFFILKVQKEQNQNNIVLEAKAIAKSLNNDLLKYLLNPNADILSDITFKISAFEKISGVILYNNQKKAVFKYKRINNIKENSNKISKTNTIFTQNYLLIKNSIKSENYNFGSIIFDVDLNVFKQKEKNIKYTILAIFPFALLFGFILSLILSKNYTKPFIELLNSIKKSHPEENKIFKAKTKAKNEVKELFDAFNKQMQQIANSSKNLQYIVNHDKLTNIYNRFFMENELQKALKDEKREGYSLLYIDLDQFKLINDSAGNQAGDKLLKMITIHYQKLLPNNGIFARVDGDGFMVLLKNCSIENGKKFLEQSLEHLKDFRFSSENETYSISASISLVFFKPFEFSLEELLKASSDSLHSAKNKGRNKSHIYSKSDEMIKRVSIEQKSAKLIKEALNKGNTKFELFAQDIVPLQEKNDKISYEILIRMWDKDNNFISPANFLPAAQRYGLMADIDSYVLWTYLETVTKNKIHLSKLQSVHINLAGSSLNNPDFQSKVKEAIEYFDFPWEKLELEVTESSAIGNFNMANEFIAWLKSNKIGLALDDFGTGMASFEYLKSMPFDVIKIDGSFVKDMHTDPTDKAVIKYIQEIASLNNQETVAEYVETKEDVKMLKEIGITYGQGFYLGKPRSLDSWLN